MKTCILIALLVFCSWSLDAQTYVSPFAIQLDSNITNWTSDFVQREAAIISNSSPAPATWYAHNYGTNGSYGPELPQLYSSSTVPDPNALNYDRAAPVYNVALNSTPTAIDPIVYQQERLLYAAKQLIGTLYQHDHLPQFNGGQASNYVWQPVTTNDYLQTTTELHTGAVSGIANPYKATAGLATNGIDCTDFAAYIYNQALGIQMHSGTASQIEFVNAGITNAYLTTNSIPTATIFSSAGAQLAPTFFTNSASFGTTNLNAAGSLSGIISQLNPGDLLYMRGAATNISHVVVWLGNYGISTNGTMTNVPLVISSHDNTPAIFNTTNIDSMTGLPVGLITNGSSNNITDFLPPPGVEILPFTSDTWFYQNFSVAMQVLPAPEPSPSILALIGICFLALVWRFRRKRFQQ